MLGVMNRVFPARRYALLGSGGLGYFVILLIRLFFIGVSAWGAYLSVAYAVGHYTSNSFGSIVESSWIAMVILPVVLWLFTMGKDLIIRNRLDSSRPAPPSLLLGIWDDSLALGEILAQNRGGWSLFGELCLFLLVPFLLLLVATGVSVAGILSLGLAVGLSSLFLLYLTYLILPRVRRRTSGAVPIQNSFFHAGMYLQGITPLRIPRKFHWGNLAPKGRLALVGFRTLILVNTALISVVVGALGFWVPGLSENVVPGVASTNGVLDSVRDRFRFGSVACRVHIGSRSEGGKGFLASAKNKGGIPG